MKTEFSPSEIHQIKKTKSRLEAIPEEKWCRWELTSSEDNTVHCVLGHLGVTNRWTRGLEESPEAMLLWEFLRSISDISEINNNSENPKKAVIDAINNRLDQYA